MDFLFYVCHYLGVILDLGTQDNFQSQYMVCSGKGGERQVMGKKKTSSRTQNKGSRKYFREIVLQSLKTNVFDVMPKFYVRESQ